jgi:hypothetical protein
MTISEQTLITLKKHVEAEMKRYITLKYDKALSNLEESYVIGCFKTLHEIKQIFGTENWENIKTELEQI